MKNDNSSRLGGGPSSTWQNPDYPTITVVVTTKNNADTIRECILSLLNQDYPQSAYDILVLDASANQSTREALAELPVRIVEFQGNAPSAYNYAIGLTPSELIGFIDGDAKADPRWLSEITRRLQDPIVAGAGGEIRTWDSTKIIPRCIGYELESRYNNPKNVVRTSTTNLVLKRKAIERIGGFDHAIDTGYDAVMGLKITSLGYKIVFVPTARVYHLHRATLAGYLRQQYTYAKNDVRMYRKNYGLLAKDNVTSKWMIAQPLLVLMLVVSSLISATSVFATIPLIATRIAIVISAGIGILLLASYSVTSIKLGLSTRELRVIPVIFCILAARAIAWTIGGAMGIGSYFIVRPSRSQA